MTVERKKTMGRRGPISLTLTLAIAFVLLGVVPLLIIGGVVTVRNFQVQQQVAASQERQNAQQAANRVSNFLEQVIGALETTIAVESPFSITEEEQVVLLESLMGAEPAFREISLLDERGQELVKRSRLQVITPDDLLNRANSDLFIKTTQNVNYLSSVHIDETTSEPLITVGVPIKNSFGEFQGVLVADVNLKFMWDLVSALRIGTNGVAYVVDRQGNLIAFSDTSRVLRGENVADLSPVADFAGDMTRTNTKFVQLSTGINGNQVLSTYVPLGQPDWAVVVELPIGEAYRALFIETGAAAAGILIVAILAGVAGIYVSQRLAAPVRDLTQTATRIAEGELELEAPLQGTAEVSTLAQAFNSMTQQLRELIQSLEDRVATRTQRLEVVATLSEQLAAILDFEQLLMELVNQVKSNFGYYHAHVYILDESRQNLVMTAGAGEAGKMMKARGHSIRYDAPTSLVARAARTGQIVWVNNVREAEDWLPNSLLPETYSEMAVPIILDEQVVGVLDVQEDRIGGLDEGDASVLRFLANQVAVAIRNARLFAEAETALAEVQAAQEKYIIDAWQKTNIKSKGDRYLYTSSDIAQLDEEKQNMLAETRRQALEQEGPTVLEGESKAIVAPIRLGQKKIGALQIHNANGHFVSEDDLVIIEAIVDQFAQTAENLRLFDETRQQAGREHTIREITERMRGAANLEELVKIAAKELGQKLSAGHAIIDLGLEVSGGRKETRVSSNGNRQLRSGSGLETEETS